MDRMLQAEGDWQASIASALSGARRPIVRSGRFAPRDAAGRTNLQRYDRATFPPARPASTLLLLYPGVGGELTVPLTVRHADLRAHAGEISLPGGAVDPGDATPADAALREAWEELGVEPSSVRILGELDPVWIPVSNFELRPFVGATPARPDFRPHDAEVSAVVELPLHLIVSEEIVADEEIDVRGLVLRTAVYRYAGQRIWGATAITLAMFAAVLAEAGIGGASVAGRAAPDP
jgi:8-oxo-dGTP pyrophosphatase MutT (NUDIX family)